MNSFIIKVDSKNYIFYINKASAHVVSHIEIHEVCAVCICIIVCVTCVNYACVPSYVTHVHEFCTYFLEPCISYKLAY